jgi:hypothetical protein
VPWRREASLTMLEAAREYQLGAAAQTDKILQLFESTQELRKVMRSLDSFLTATMEGRIAKGQEAYVRSLLEIVGVFFPSLKRLPCMSRLSMAIAQSAGSFPLC